MRRLSLPLEAFCRSAYQSVSPGKKQHVLGTTIMEFQAHASVLLLDSAPLPLQGDSYH